MPCQCHLFFSSFIYLASQTPLALARCCCVPVQLAINAYTMVLAEASEHTLPGLLEAKSWVFGAYVPPLATISEVTTTRLVFDATVTPANRATNLTITTEVEVGGRRLSYEVR